LSKKYTAQIQLVANKLPPTENRPPGRSRRAVSGI
jgi:hypothetical protein